MPIVSTQRTSWGRVESVRELTVTPYFQDEIPGCFKRHQTGFKSILPVGLGRSYGNSGTNDGNAAVDMTCVDRILAFNTQSGILKAEAGLSLDSLLQRIVPSGWFLPTTPGTRYVTLGGAVANDVHGKNHPAAGTIGRWLRRMGICRSDTGYMEIDPVSHPELWKATIGGLGLTGIIQWVELQLTSIDSSSLDSYTQTFSSLNQYFDLMEDTGAEYEHKVAWIDCLSRGKSLGRGILTMSQWAKKGPLQSHKANQALSLPFNAPAYALNAFTLASFNSLYFAKARANQGLHTEHYSSVFYPLDSIQNWNRLYGKKGFFQYQVVIPRDSARAGIAALLDKISKARQGSFLAVLKSFGDLESPGLLSFPMQGTTLALDFPNRGNRTFALLEELDSIVKAHGGRLYPAKDGRMSKAMFSYCFGHVLQSFVECADPALSSDFWRRVT